MYDAHIDINKISIKFESEKGDIMLCDDSKELDFDENLAKKIMSTNHIKIICDMKEGTYDATAYGCDLTHKYVDINASYRS